MKNYPILLILLCAFLTFGSEANAEEIESNWTSLYTTSGCLTGGQHWHKHLSEGSVFRKKEWKQLFKLNKKNTIPFLMKRLKSTNETKIHVCPFHNATEGELAVYVSEHILNTNWYDAGSNYKHLSEWSIKRKESLTPVTKLMLNDNKAVSELKKYFLGKIKHDL